MELIVVIAIMAILAAVAVVSFNIYIQKAKEANDEEYRSNVEYFAKLEATEHQFKLEEVKLQDVVDGPEDIILKVELPSGQVVEYSHSDEDYGQIIRDIFDAVGPWTFSYACDHANCEKTITPANCQENEFYSYSCAPHILIEVPNTASDSKHVINQADIAEILKDIEKSEKVGKYKNGTCFVECQQCGNLVPCVESAMGWVPGNQVDGSETEGE